MCARNVFMCKCLGNEAHADKMYCVICEGSRDKSRHAHVHVPGIARVPQPNEAREQIAFGSGPSAVTALMRGLGSTRTLHTFFCPSVIQPDSVESGRFVAVLRRLQVHVLPLWPELRVEKLLERMRTRMTCKPSRVWASYPGRNYIFSFFGLVDLVTVAPFWIQILCCMSDRPVDSPDSAAQKFVDLLRTAMWLSGLQAMAFAKR